MDLQDFEKLALRTTGLVPMQMLKDIAPNFKGDIAGLFPAAAKDYFDKGAAVPLGRDGKPVKVAAPKKKAGTVSAANPAGEIAIPENWRDLHHLQMIPIAAQISGEKVTKKDEAIAIIELELKRREG